MPEYPFPIKLELDKVNRHRATQPPLPGLGLDPGRLQDAIPPIPGGPRNFDVSELLRAYRALAIWADQTVHVLALAGIQVEKEGEG